MTRPRVMLGKSRESSNPIKHIYDELIFVLSGHGASTIWSQYNTKQTFV